jgi:hypothetical protein
VYAVYGSRMEGIMEHYVITIARGYGSGGRTMGKILAEELGIHFYDRNYFD